MGFDLVIRRGRWFDGTGAPSSVRDLGIRQGVVVYPPPERTVGLESLRRFKEDAKEVRAGFECGLKIAGYDDLTAAQVASRLDDLEPAELREVRSYERRNANRKTVLAAVERKLDG